MRDWQRNEQNDGDIMTADAGIEEQRGEAKDAARDLLIAKVASEHREHAEAKAEADEIYARDCRNDKESGWWL